MQGSASTPSPIHSRRPLAPGRSRQREDCLTVGPQGQRVVARHVAFLREATAPIPSYYARKRRVSTPLSTRRTIGAHLPWGIRESVSTAPVVATEFVTPAITSGGDATPYGPYYAPMVPFNPHIKYYEGDRRGYFLATVTQREMRVDLRFVTSVENKDGSGYAERSFVVEDGRPGARPA
jgi:hypothetical protein